MRTALLLAAAPAALLAALLPAGAENPRMVRITVAETAGIRRFGYPVSAAVPLPPGAVTDPARLALEQNGTVLRGVQYDAGPRRADGSLSRVTLSFNLSPGPLEKQSLILRWGPDVSHPDPGPGVVEETAEAFRIRSIYRIPRRGAAFLDSLRYGAREFLAKPATWQAWGAAEEPPLALVPGSERSRIVAPGPINAVVELSGAFQGSAGPIPYTLTVAQPNSKSWFDAVMALDDPRREVSRLRLSVPFVVERAPVLYDFGVGSWIYGTLRGEESATLEAARGRPWRILTAAGQNPPSVYAAASPAQPRAEGWGHLIDGAQGGRAVGFGTTALDERGGADRCDLAIRASGEVAITWSWTGRGRRRARALFHQVNDPIQVSAVTSPPAMLHPLEVKLGGE